MNEKLLAAVREAMSSHHVIGTVSQDSCCTFYNVTNGATQIGGTFVTPEDAVELCAQLNAQAAIAAHSAFIREAAGRDDVVEAGDNAVREIIGRLPPPTAEEVQEARFKGMLDQIERTPDEG
jgi:hypothetical protein